MTFELPEDTPDCIRRLPRERRGYPIPAFVATEEEGNKGRDLRFASAPYKRRCADEKICWVCGEALSIPFALLGGPMSLFNRKFSDFPMHPECAIFSAKYCPHLARSHSRYRDDGKDELHAHEPVGLISKHPGIICMPLVEAGTLEFLPDGDIFMRPVKLVGIEFWFEGERINADRAAELWKAPDGLPSRWEKEIRGQIKRSFFINE